MCGGVEKETESSDKLNNNEKKKKKLSPQHQTTMMRQCHCLVNGSNSYMLVSFIR